MKRNLLTLVLIEIGYVIRGILKVPIFVIRWILALPLYLLAKVAQFGRPRYSSYSDNLFGQICNWLTDVEL